MTTKMEHKNILAELLEAEDESGSFEAIIATFGVADADGDVIEKGAFGDATVAILPAHDSGSVPLGKAKIEERNNLAVAKGRFNLDVAAARDWHKAIKFDLESPPAIAQWSWGFLPVEWRMGELDGQEVRFLSKLDMMEVSPVLRGASVGTRTLSAKHRSDPVEEDAKEEAITDTDADAPSGDAADDGATDGENGDGGVDDRPSVKLVDHLKLASDMVEAVVARIGALAESRVKQGKSLGHEAVTELLRLGAEVEGLTHLCRSVNEIATAPDATRLDEKARALADYMAHRARWGR